MSSVISFVVCSNGFGHFKRALSVCNELTTQSEDIAIHIFCDEKHFNFLENEPNFSVDKSKVSVHTSLSSDPKWLHPESITVQSWTNWIELLKENEMLKSSDLVISDNQVAPVSLPNNTMLMGSFLWSTMNFPKATKELEEVQELEKQLLLETNPYCMCVGDVKMPGVTQYTQPVEVPWFCEKYPTRDKEYRQKERLNILISGGGTKMLTQMLIDLYQQMSILAKFNLFVDRHLFKSLKELGETPVLFDFTQESFRQLDTIICRPGVGILTDSVIYNIPLCVLREEGNDEIIHNTERVQDLGFGIVYNTSEELIQFVEDPKRMNDCVQNLENTATGGAKVAAEFILSSIKKNDKIAVRDQRI